MIVDSGKFDCALIGLWVSNNYGSVLTAWSLYKTLEKMGFKPVLVDVINAPNKETQTGRFIREKCNTTREYGSTLDLSELNLCVSTFIVGSDQNWHDGWINDYRGYPFFLDFVDDDKKKISYATSFGNNDFRGSSEEYAIIKHYLKRFDYISLREKSAAALWSKELDREIEFVIDPVFLTSTDEYKSIAGSKDLLKPYLFEMILDGNDDLIDSGREIAEKLGISYELCFGADYTYKGEYIEDGTVGKESVERILQRIIDASYVMTDSYHITCFSILFHKPFIVIKNERGLARIQSLLNNMGFDSDTLIHDYKDLDVGKVVNIFTSWYVDWDMIDAKIVEWSAASKKWLLAALQSPKGDNVPKINSRLFLAEALGLASSAKRTADSSIKRIEIVDNVILDLYEKVNMAYLEINKVYAEINKVYAEIHNIHIENRRRAVYQYLAEQLTDCKRIAIRGGGFHTIKLLELMSCYLKTNGIIVEYIIDRSKGVFEPGRIEKITPEEFWSKDFTVDAVILSSSRYLMDFCKETQKENKDRYHIINPYNAFFKGEILSGQAWYE